MFIHLVSIYESLQQYYMIDDVIIIILKNSHPGVCFIDLRDRERDRQTDRHQCERETAIGCLL